MKWVKKIGFVFVLLIGLSLVFNQQLKNSLIHFDAQRANQTKLGQPNIKADYNFANVEALDTLAVLKASLTKQNAQAKLAIPAVHLKLPVFNGLNNEYLAAGAGMMKPKQKLGRKNYALAGHHLQNERLLFGPLAKLETTANVYLTDGQKLYCYQVIKKVVVDRSQSQYLNDVKGQKLLTLVTCASGRVNEKRRLIIQAKFIKETTLTQKGAKMFQ